MDDTWIGTWGWVTLALVNAGPAEQKNRSRLAWFLGSLVLGPVATAVIVISPSVPADDDGQRASRRAADEPGVALLGSGILVLVLSALPAVVAMAVDEPAALWILTAVGVVAAATLIVLHVLARRRWRARRPAA